MPIFDTVMVLVCGSGCPTKPNKRMVTIDIAIDLHENLLRKTLDYRKNILTTQAKQAARSSNPKNQ